MNFYLVHISALDNFGSVFYVFIILKLPSGKNLKTCLLKESCKIFSDIFFEIHFKYKESCRRKCENFFRIRKLRNIIKDGYVAKTKWTRKLPTKHSGWIIWVRDVKWNRSRSFCFIHKRGWECDVTSVKQQNVFPSSHWGKSLRKPHNVEDDVQTPTFYKSTNLQVFGLSAVIFLFTLPKFRKCM